MRVLVTGGAGYIGSHAVRRLVEAGHEVVVYDNLSRGHIKALHNVPFVLGDISNTRKTAQTIKDNHISTIMHFAALSQVGESFNEPQIYYLNNLVGTIKLLETALYSGVKYFVFSSSAAVYGESEESPIPENHRLAPTNPYGRTKMMIEMVLADYGKAYGLKTVCLRYFNAAGAAPEGDIGEDHDTETHLIPLVLQAVLGLREELTVFGTDYPTNDGTAIRDYVHVDDLARAHILAMENLIDGASTVYNLGNGSGYSVLEVIQAAERVIGQPISYKIGNRRAGDPVLLVASSEKAMRELGWKPEYTSLDQIIKTAWEWHKKYPGGYRHKITM